MVRFLLGGGLFTSVLECLTRSHHETYSTTRDHYIDYMYLKTGKHCNVF
ncbi:hypothetical protein VPHK459_0043 [Vibrio phage K459]